MENWLQLHFPWMFSRGRLSMKYFRQTALSCRRLLPRNSQNKKDEQSDAPKSAKGAFYQWRDHRADLVIRNVRRPIHLISEPEQAHRNAKPRRHWLRYGLRALLFATVVIAALLTLFGRHVIRIRTERPVVAQVEAAGGSAYYDYQLEPGRVDTTKPPVGSSVIRSIVGDDFYATVNVVFLNDAGTTDADVEKLHQLSNLLDLSITGSGVTDDCIDDLLRVRKLRSLKLTDTSISADGLARLSQSFTLQQIALYGSSITDDHLKQLSQFPNLQFLQIIRAPVTDDGIASLAAITKLRQLDLFMTGPGWPNPVPGSRNTNITDFGIQKLGQLSDLEQLRILTTAITDEALGTIALMAKLRFLKLDGHPITDDGIVQLRSLTSLEGLHLADTQIGDAALDTISQLKSLRYLDLSGTSITNAGLVHLSTLSDLETLNLNRTTLTNDGLSSLATLVSLRTLDLEIDNGITHNGVDALKSQLPSCTIRFWEMRPDGSGVLAGAR